MAPSPESFSVHDRFFSKDSPVPFIAPLCLWCSLRASPFSLLSSNSRAPEGISTSEQPSAHAKEPPRIRIPGEGSSAGSFSSPLLRLWLPFSQWGLGGSWHSGSCLVTARLGCGCGCLQCPPVTCSRCNHNSRRGGGRMPRGVWTPLFFLWLCVDFPALVCAAPLELPALAAPESKGHQTNNKGVSFYPPPSCTYSLPIQDFLRDFAIPSIRECWFQCAYC